MRVQLFCVVLTLACAACTGGPGLNDGGFGGSGGGGGKACDDKNKCDEGFFCLSGTCTSQFQTFDLDNGGPHLTYLAAAFDPAQRRVGVAYYVQMDAFAGALGPEYFEDGGLKDGLKAADGGNTANYELRYVEVKDGVVGTPEVLRTVQRLVGVSVAFQQTGEPAVAYLGGGADMSAFWYQSDAVISYRSAGVWTEQLVAARSETSPCLVPDSTTGLNIGFAVGLFPGLVFDGPKAWLAFRDVHNGQFPQQDWNGSFIKVAEGTPGAYTVTCQVPTNTGKLSFGGRINMVMGKDNQPAFIHDRATGGADTPGTDIWFTRRLTNGTWSNEQAPKLITNNTMTGGGFAYDPVEGFGIAAIDHQEDKLYYTHDDDGLGSWAMATAVIGLGSNGWYPSLAMDPVNHEPAIAYYFCSDVKGTAEGKCPASKDELRITQRIVGNWRESRVDLEGGYQPKIGFFGEKRVVAYRVPSSFKIRLAVER